MGLKLREVIAYRVRVLRTRAGMSQAQLADRLPCTISMVSMMERGKREPSLSMIRKLAEVFDVEPYTFLLPPKKKED